MLNRQVSSSAIALLQSPDLQQIQIAAQWLANQPFPNPDLEVALNLVLQGQIVPQKTGEFIAIAYNPSNGEFLTDAILGIVMARPGNTTVSLESGDRTTAKALLAQITSRGCPHRIATSGQTKNWVRPLLLEHYHLDREHNPLVMICTQAPGGGVGRWALPQDKLALQAYAEAYRAERGSGSVTQNWDELIRQKRVAVLEQDGEIISVVKRSSTFEHGIVVGTFTFPAFRQQGFARRLLAFFVTELLKEHTAVKLWVDDDNLGAIALYHSVGFQVIGSCYTGHFKN